MKFCIKNFFSKCDPIRNFLRIWSHLLKKSLMENFVDRFWSLGLYYHLSQLYTKVVSTFYFCFSWWTNGQSRHIANYKGVELLLTLHVVLHGFTPLLVFLEIDLLSVPIFFLLTVSFLYSKSLIANCSKLCHSCKFQNRIYCRNTELGENLGWDDTLRFTLWLIQNGLTHTPNDNFTPWTMFPHTKLR